MLERLRRKEVPLISIGCEVPVRICDIGGWIDTHFTEHGSVCNLSVYAGTDGGECQGVRAEVEAKLSSGERKIRLIAPDIDLDLIEDGRGDGWDTSKLLGATMSAITPYFPSGIDLRITATAGCIPPGASVGTSASITTAIIAAIEYLNRGEIDADWVARSAHEVETLVMGVECGVQDQWAAAWACGAGLVDIWQYPNCRMLPIGVREDVVATLEDRLFTVVYGSAHRSGDIHKMVIEELQQNGRLDPRLEAFRILPAEARYCLVKGDLRGYGKVLFRNTEAQKALHPDLISEECQGLIDLAQGFGAWGWKVNGAGGPDGGSLSVLCGSKGKEVVIAEIRRRYPGLVILEHKLARGGIKVWADEM